MLKPYRCSHCSQRIVVLETTTGSVLPVEIAEGVKPPDEERDYDKDKDVSHLKNCPKLAAEWEKKKKKFIERNNPFAFLDYKALQK